MWKSILKHFKSKKDSNRFRVLILGPANAGKTTLLERLTDSPAGAAIVTRNGKRVITADVQLNRTAGLMHPFLSQIKEVPRGYDQVRAIVSKACYGCSMLSHDLARDPQHRGRNHLRIKPRLRFPRLWWFRGGRGQGGRGCLAIYSKALASSAFTATACDLVRSPVHVHMSSILRLIHYYRLCIPTDSDRPFGFLQSGFFSKPTASGMSQEFHHLTLSVHRSVYPLVPVIGIFTKLDGRETKMMSEVLGPAPNPSDFLDRAPEVQRKVAEFMDGLETQFQKQQYPPAGFIRVGSMYALSE
jgi:hypothetical protein